MAEFICTYMPDNWGEKYRPHLGEEIVRCKDCEHFEKTVQFGICHRSEFLPMWAELNGYCAWGERKEGGE